MAKDTLLETINKKKQDLKNFKKNQDNNTILQGLEKIIRDFQSENNIKLFCEKHKNIIEDYIKNLSSFKSEFLEEDKPKDKKIIDEIPKLEKLYKNTIDSNQPKSDRISSQQSSTPKSVTTTAVKKTTRMSNNHTNNSNPNINKHEQDINDSLKSLSTKIEALTTSTTSNEIKDIKKKIDSLKLDLSYEIKQQFDKRKDTDEVIDTLPAKFLDLSKKIDSIESSSHSKKNLEIPKDEQAVVDLTKFMKDGLEQLENIGRYYISKQSEFEKFENQNQNHQDALIKAKKEGFEDGEKSKKIKLAKIIYDKYPNKFKDIKDVFTDILIEEYEIDQEIEITKDNRQEFELKIAGITKESIVIIQSPAILIAGEVVEKATIKESN